MKKFIYVMFEDVERVVECPIAVCNILAELLAHQTAENEEFSTREEAKNVARLWHLFAYHAITCETNPDVLNRSLAHKAIVEEGRDYVEVYERVS